MIFINFIVSIHNIIQGDHALSFLRYVASAFQIYSAIQDQDFATVPFDLKTINHLNLKKWKGQYLSTSKPAYAFSSNKQLQNLVGTVLHYIKDIVDMKRENLMIPKIHDGSSLKCDKCYLTCLDSRYQAIIFDNFNSNDYKRIIHWLCFMQYRISCRRVTDIIVNRGVSFEKEPEGLINHIPNRKK